MLPLEHHFSPEGVWLNTATYGLSPLQAQAEIHRELDNWMHGRVDFPHWDSFAPRARAAFARLTGADERCVTAGAQVSHSVGLVAASLPRGSRVVAVEGDFTSLLWPFMACGHEVALVPLERLAEAVDAGTDVVAFSAVQSSDGRVADLDAIRAAAAHHGAMTVNDATQACGWLPLRADDWDVMIAGTYKWLLSPRGTCLTSIREAVWDRLTPVHANWTAGDDVHSSYYDGPLRLAPDARRFDTSPAWHAWVGTAPALELLADTGTGAIHDHDVRLANRLREGLGLEPSNSAIVSVQLDPDAGERLLAAGIRAAGRAGRLRMSCHLYTTDADVDRTLTALAARTAP